MSRNRRLVVLVVSLVLACAPAVQAGTFTYIAAFGDSWSDNGNLFAVVGFPPPPYFDGRFSNGPVLVEYLASRLNVQLFDFAFGAATTGVGDFADGGDTTHLGSLGIPGMSTQYARNIVTLHNIPKGLFFIWGGVNDLILVNFDRRFLAGTTAAAVDNIGHILSDLQSRGGGHVLVLAMMDLGLFPAFHHKEVLGTFASSQFNQALAASLPSGVIFFDTFKASQALAADSRFTNRTDPCFDGITVCANPDQYVFWDSLHLTTAAQHVLADQVAGALQQQE